MLRSFGYSFVLVLLLVSNTYAFADSRDLEKKTKAFFEQTPSEIEVCLQFPKFLVEATRIAKSQYTNELSFRKLVSLFNDFYNQLPDKTLIKYGTFVKDFASAMYELVEHHSKSKISREHAFSIALLASRTKTTPSIKLNDSVYQAFLEHFGNFQATMVEIQILQRFIRFSNTQKLPIPRKIYSLLNNAARKAFSSNDVSLRDLVDIRPYLQYTEATIPLRMAWEDALKRLLEASLSGELDTTTNWTTKNLEEIIYFSQAKWDFFNQNNFELWLKVSSKLLDIDNSFANRIALLIFYSSDQTLDGQLSNEVSLKILNICLNELSNGTLNYEILSNKAFLQFVNSKDPSFIKRSFELFSKQLPNLLASSETKILRLCSIISNFMQFNRILPQKDVDNIQSKIVSLLQRDRYFENPTSIWYGLALFADAYTLAYGPLSKEFVIFASDIYQIQSQSFFAKDSKVSRFIIGFSGLMTQYFLTGDEIALNLALKIFLPYDEKHTDNIVHPQARIGSWYKLLAKNQNTKALKIFDDYLKAAPNIAPAPTGSFLQNQIYQQLVEAFGKNHKIEFEAFNSKTYTFFDILIDDWLAIEIDGPSHFFRTIDGTEIRRTHDLLRDRVAKEANIEVLRFPFQNPNYTPTFTVDFTDGIKVIAEKLSQGRFCSAIFEP